MEAFKTLIWIVNIFSSLAIIVLVLMQHGKGADAGASFGGSGSAQGVFGSAGNANFLSRMTAISAMIFFASCLALGYVNSNSGKKSGLDFSTVKQTTTTPSSTTETPIPQAASGAK
ncbi:preprotein translocase subunit SecG [Wielerella bovis]|uniref:preprotein translocase subunit SecG n=1 Tax=Wielerella bovis TaxID=2917790 RepID=UPI002019B833|nr:preprotein translocase subunit SecG [Wielerella bovis]MCG7657508.1 preprotein translocase subunit SecG [Wielerella bovis]MCG7659729.1 preprotein translocase subunit SecG [Wielerella bovis]ULJ59664.1 preprotein translocase subunit SecG [Wielerella bovis]ULJ61902.1 preprotein translocase subunit SecG [Wielerella bovis]ULJ64089.1 preprotein translocase subunit SecG [Wielerella bovis]